MNNFHIAEVEPSDTVPDVSQQGQIAFQILQELLALGEYITQGSVPHNHKIAYVLTENRLNRRGRRRDRK